MKVRVGYGFGTQRGFTAAGFNAMVDALEALRFDSLWLSERITADAPDPIIGLAVAAGRTEKLKLGTSVQVLPGRNPALLAKELASLDVLCNGRFLPAFGLGIAHPAEQQAFGLERAERAPWFEEALPLLRRFWTEDAVDHSGPRFHFEGLKVRPHPVQQPPDIWLGGRGPKELRRVGRLADGWLASFSMPSETATGRATIEAVAADHGRTIDPEHFGAMIIYSAGPLPPPVKALLATRAGEVDPADLVPGSLDALERRISEYVDVGISKLVLVPLHEPADWRAELEPIASRVQPLQT
jgi:probable F420-dependent oxidoreductase